MSATPLQRGSLIIAEFPRMTGKRRPGLVIEAVARSSVVVTVVAAPFTSQRQGQAARMPTSAVDSAPLGRPSWLLPERAAVLPPRRIIGVLGLASAELVEAADAAIAAAFGPNWRRTQPPLDHAPPRPRLLHATSRKRVRGG